MSWLGSETFCPSSCSHSGQRSTVQFSPIRLINDRQIRPLTLTRKNSLFAGHDEGGRSWARIASLIATCKINSVEPYVWMKATLKAIATGHPQSRIDELLTWSFGRTS
ncbi:MULTISPECIES: transposase domain-containing protein [Bradyrhizobium]